VIAFTNVDLLMLLTIFILLLVLIFTSVAEMGLSRITRPKAASLADQGHKAGKALKRSGVTIDSTVYANGRSEGTARSFDFHGAPAKSRWRFETDPLVEVADGAFLEVPIASRRVAPGFFWRLAAMKKLGGARHRAFGDGAPLALERGDLMRKLLRPTHSVVSMDGYKASFLGRAADEYRARGFEDFVVIGHPKALTPYSLDQLDAFLGSGRAGEISTFATYH